MNKPLLYSILIVAVAAPIYLIGSPSTGFQGTDELRYGQIAKELGPSLPDYFLLHFNGVRYTDKPPLYFWTVRLAYELTGGLSPFALRLPGVASALVCLVLVYLLMRELTRREMLALAAAATLMVTPRFLWISRWGRLDIMMCVFIYAGMLQFVRAWFGGRGRVGGLWFWTALGLAFAVKGPAGPVVMLGATMTFLIWERFASGESSPGRGGRLRAARTAIRPLFNWQGVVAALLVNLAWYGPIFVLDRTSGSTDMVVDELVTRTFTPDRHVEPPPYYLKNIWYDGLPAMPFILFLVVLLVLERRNRKKEREVSVAVAGLSGEFPQVLRFLLSWFAFTLIFFSIYPPKRAQYLLPMYPALAGLGVLFVDYCQRRCSTMPAAVREARFFRIPAGVILFAITVLGLGLLWRVELGGFAAGVIESSNPELALEIRTGVEEFEYGVYHLSRAGQIAGSVIVLLVAVTGVWFLVTRAFWRAYALVLGAAYGGIFFFFGWMIPPVFPDADLRRIAAETEERLRQRPELKVCMYGEDKPFYNIYGDFHIHYFEDETVRDEFFSFVQLNTPVMVILEEKEARKHGDDPPLDGMTRRETTMRGRAVTIFETPE